MSDFLALIGRICMSGVFIAYGLPKLQDSASLVNHAGAKRFFDMVLSGMAVPPWFGYLIGGIEFLGGVAILFGVRTRLVAWLFVIYIILITGFSHPFWLMDAASYAAQKSNFYKNLAILGAFFMLIAHGPGAISVDGRGAKPPV